MTRMLNYPVVLHKDSDSDYGVTVPDLPGCFSAGSTIDEALAMAREAIELHLEGLFADGENIPRPTVIERRRDKPDTAGGFWALVSIDAAPLSFIGRRADRALRKATRGRPTRRPRRR